MKFQSRVAVVTGAARGIGKAASVRLAREGATVVIADIADAEGEALAQSITDAGGSAVYQHCDVLEREQIDALIDGVVSRYGAIDILVNNAGGAIVAGNYERLYEASPDSIERMLGVNLMGTVWATRAAARAMKAQRSGKIINLSSVAGMQGGTPAMYATSKGAIIAFTKSLAFEMAEFGVTVNCISPWAIATREGPASLPTRIGRTGTADEVASLIAFLASDEADFITGSNYVMDGGFTSGRGA